MTETTTKIYVKNFRTTVQMTAEEFYTELICEISEENMWDFTRQKAAEIAIKFIEEVVGIGANDVILTKTCPKAVIRGYIQNLRHPA